MRGIFKLSRDNVEHEKHTRVTRVLEFFAFVMSVDFPWALHYVFAIVWSSSLLTFTWYVAPDTGHLVACIIQAVLGGKCLWNCSDEQDYSYLTEGVGFCTIGGIINKKDKKVNHLQICLIKSEKWKIQQSYLSKADFWHAYWLGTHNIVHTSIESGNLPSNHCNVTLGCLLHYFLVGGKGTKLFTDIHHYGLFHSIANILLVWLLIDAGAYYVHKWLHIPWFYRNIHKW